VNNVTIYEVDLIPQNTPWFFRSGMNANIDFIEQEKGNILLLPKEAVYKEGQEDYVLIKTDSHKNPIKKRVILGISDDKNVEVISGLTEDDTVFIIGTKYSLPKSTFRKNPFIPTRRR
ncbi:MAG: efflux RND transporter periplasmic adaptor subunit, partial [Candidatus Omnitrophica bacterium]|nr:efflux RND transporter periplasmic adaptor subunit [Candidatus Omnitrophota bacterium]